MTPSQPPNSPHATALTLPTPGELVATGSGLGDAITAVHAWAGARAADRTLIFLTATIENAHTRRAYRRAVTRFVEWCIARALPIERISAPLVAAHVAELGRTLTPPSVKLHLSALNHWCDQLVIGHVLEVNPVHAVRGPRYKQPKGKTTVFDAAEVKELFGSIDPKTLVGARDRALMGLMLYSFARIGAVLEMRVADYRGAGSSRPTFLLHEKGGKEHRVHAHHRACEYLDAYVELAGLGTQPHAALWQGMRHGALTGRRLTQGRACEIIQARCRAAGLSEDFCNHSFRATGISLFRKAGGDLRIAQQIAGHADIKTTALYGRSGEDVQRAEIERVQL